MHKHCLLCALVSFLNVGYLHSCESKKSDSKHEMTASQKLSLFKEQLAQQMNECVQLLKKTPENKREIQARFFSTRLAMLQKDIDELDGTQPQKIKKAGSELLYQNRLINSVIGMMIYQAETA